MNSSDNAYQKSSHSRGGFGLILILLGLLLLASNVGWIPQGIKEVVFRWPMILVVIGLINIFKREMVSGLILLAVGGFFMLPHLVPGLRMADLWRYWPVLLILAGIAVLWGRKRLDGGFLPKEVSHADRIDEVAVFGGNQSHVESQNFHGGRVTAVFGGSELSFAGSKLSDEGAVIDFMVVFGGSKILVPRDWNVKVEVMSILGGFADKRPQFQREATVSPTLIIKGIAIFGGGEITSY